MRHFLGDDTKMARFPKTVLDAASKESKALYAVLSGKSPTWKKIDDDYVSFRRHQHLWSRFAEAGFDNYMQQLKL
jgi:TRAP-type mannitol/chloroaromatic compound transport system substrate-binding protein